MDVAKLSVGHVGIYLCGLYVGVAEHHLNASDVCAILEQVGGKRVTENVGRDFA